MIHPPPCTVTQDVSPKPLPLTAGKKVKNINKAPMTSKVNQNLTLRTENEDTCNSDDFSSYYQANSNDCK